MIPADFHTHTVFSDGKNTPEEMILAAIDRGMAAIGFSDHSYTFFDESYCLPKAKIESYKAEIRRLGEKYRDRIRVFCGIEQDLFSEASTEGFDYVIGSVHYLHIGETYIPVDEKPEILLEAAEKHFGGDMIALAECYFSEAAEVIARTDADIIGHFDLIRKFNKGGKLFSEEDPRYIAAAQKAADALLAAGKPFEINTGAISRGYQDAPYPSPAMQAYIAEKGGCFLYSSDSHNTGTLMAGFDGEHANLIDFQP